ncbi:hypothetical protein B0H13DRAFT_2334150 [Mycena leptocephala]|nr:hypothetical protein B0H13DRAFT_2334150 [Mycena leptocephala]
MSATESSRRATVMEVDDIDPMEFRKAPPLLDPSGPILAGNNILVKLPDNDTDSYTKQSYLLEVVKVDAMYKNMI